MTEMHWVITIQFEGAAGRQPIAYYEGTVTPEAGQSRQDLFLQIFRTAVGKYREGAAWEVSFPVPLFFSLEPNTLDPDLEGIWHTPGGGAGTTT